MTTIQVGESETLTLGGNTQLAVVEDGQCYLIDISPSGETLSMTPTPVIFQNIGSEEEVDEESNDNTIALQYFSSNPNSTEGHQIYLDDEQARAVANLLEFHNQQTNPSASNISNGLITTPIACNSTSGYCKQDNFLNVMPTDHSIITGDVDSLSMQEPKIGLAPLRTYGKTPKYLNDKDVKVYRNPKLNSNAVTQPQLSNTLENSESTSGLKPMLPISAGVVDLNAPKRKRRLFTDAVKVIPISEFKQQLEDTSDIVQPKMDCAPPSKKAMYYLTYGGVGKFFAYPGRKLMSVPLAKLFFSRLSVTTEPKHYISASSKDMDIEPLDAELRTPVRIEEEDSPEMQSRSTILATQTFNDAIAKKTANSFDYFCKGMTRPPKYEYKRKRSKTLIMPSSSAKTLSKPMSTKEISGMTKPEPNIFIVNGSQSPGEHCVEIDSNGLVKDSSKAGIICTVRDNYTTKTETHTQPLPETYDENGDHQESTSVPSNFDMLIAAAEQHKNLPTLPGVTVDESESEILTIKEDEAEEDGIVKSEVVFCSNDSVSMEELIILGANGERYRMTASNQGELTLMPITDCDTQIVT